MNSAIFRNVQFLIGKGHHNLEMTFKTKTMEPYVIHTHINQSPMAGSRSIA
jgi:hypothetical protein